MTVQINPKTISRRQFLKKSGWVAAGVTVTVFGFYRVGRANMPALPTFDGPRPQDGLAWVQALVFLPKNGNGARRGLGACSGGGRGIEY